MDEQMPSTKCVLEIVKDGDGWELQLVRDGETPWPIARSVLPMEIRHTHEPHPVNPTEQELHTEIERLQRENADLRHDLVRAMVNHSKNISSAPEPPAEPVAYMHVRDGRLVRAENGYVPVPIDHFVPLYRRPSPPPSAARFAVGERVEWTNMLQNTFVGSVRNVATENRYVVQFDDGTVGERVESELRPVLTKCTECQGYGIVRHPGGRSEPYPCPSCTPPTPACSSGGERDE